MSGNSTGSQDKGTFGVLFVVTVLGAGGDIVTTVVTLLSVFPGSNVLIWLFAILGGSMIALVTSCHDLFLKRGQPSLALLWVIAFLLDAITAWVGATFYVILGQPLSSPIDFSKVTFIFDLRYLIPNSLGLGIAAMLFTSTFNVVGIFKKWQG